MPKNPMLFFPYNYCLNCKTNSIELYSWHNYPQKYAKLIDQYKLTGISPVLDKYAAYTMRCNRCGKEYKIAWEDGFPRPCIDDFEKNLFMDKFRDDGLAGRPHIVDNIYEKRMNENGTGDS